jgi:D-xylose reductase
MAKAQNEAWGLGYIDLFLIHFPSALEYISPEKRRYPGWWMDDAGTVSPAKVPIRETWEALEELVDSGIAKSIGVSNFQAQSLYDLFTYAKHPVSSLQIEHHPYLVQPNLIKMAQTHDIAITAYSSFGPQSFLELPEVFRQRAADVSLLFDADTIKSISSKHKVTPAQVLLRWATQRNIAVIPKSNNKERLAQNLDVLSFELTKEEIESISALDKGLRFNDPGHYLPNHPLHLFA